MKEAVVSDQPKQAGQSPSNSKFLRWRIVFLLMALCFISHFNRISMAIAADEHIMKEYGITPAQMGRIYSGFLVVYTVFMAAGGYFIDRFGVRMALLVVAVGSGAFAATTGLLGMIVNFASDLLVGLAVVRGLMGFVTTPLHPACAKTISTWIPAQGRSAANGLVTGAALLGIASTFPLFGKLMDLFGWSVAFLIAGTVTILLGALWSLWASDNPPGSTLVDHAPEVLTTKLGVEHEKEDSSWTKLLLNPSLLWLTLGYAAVGYFQYLFFYWIHYYFESVLVLGTEKSRWYAAIPVLVMAFCMPAGGWMADVMERRYGRSLGRKIIPMGGMVLSAALLGLGLMAKEPSMMVFWFALSFGAVGAAEGPFWLTAVELGGKRGGAAAAIINIGGNGIGLLAPLFTPMISASVGWKWGISIGGLVCIAGGLCWWPIRIPFPLDKRSTTQNA
jgi:ACS family D-galactonate transporter-like MFS transporter